MSFYDLRIGKGRKRKTHGKSRTSEYRVWACMRSRCLDSKMREYPNYGGRGIRICERWSSFENFLTDMGLRPKGTSLDRIDNEGNYEPSNCRWSTPKQQAENRRTTVLVELDGQRMSITKACLALGGFVPDTVLGRLRKGRGLPKGMERVKIL